MKCPHCQADNADGAKFCTDCGQLLQTDVVCSQCHHTNKPTAKFCEECGQPLNKSQTLQLQPSAPSSLSLPSYFAAGRYQVKKFLGEGGKKKVYLAHDTVLDRDVVFALIKTEKLDDVARTRIKREARRQSQALAAAFRWESPPSRLPEKLQSAIVCEILQVFPLHAVLPSRI